MSRSEHATRREPRDPGDLTRKRRIKRLIAEERARLEGPRAPAAAEGVPITIVDEGRYVHYPASIADLRGVMARLPFAIDGLSGIELCLGRVPHDAGDPDAADRYVVDPWVGRPGHERMPGVYSRAVIGTY